MLDAGIVKVADFDASRWDAAPAAGVGLAFQQNHLVLSPVEKDGMSGGKVSLTLKSPQRMPDRLLRFGVWFHAGERNSVDKIEVHFRDSKGRIFSYTMPGSRIPGWNYVDSFELGVAERGQLHGSVGRMQGKGKMIPVRPVDLLGVDIFPRKSGKGAVVLREITSDDTGREPTVPRWGMLWNDSYSKPGIVWSGDAPFIPAGHLLPDGGRAQVELEVWKTMEQGEKVASKRLTLDVPPGDLDASFRRIPLGEFPRGNYTVIAKVVPGEPERVCTPDHWKRLFFRAEGDCLWKTGDASAGRRFFRAVKSAGRDHATYLGWRQWFDIPEPGKYRLKFSVRTSGGARVTVNSYDRARKVSGKGGSVILNNPNREWQTFEKEIEFPEGTVRAFVEAVQNKNGETDFDDISLTPVEKSAPNLIRNGGGEEGAVGMKRRFPLSVVYSPVDGGAFAGQPAIYGAFKNTEMDIEVPEAFRNGETRWKIVSTMGKTLAAGSLEKSRTLKWKAPAPGAYNLFLEARDGRVLLDSTVMRIGVQTPLPEGFADGRLPESIPHDRDFFGPGKNYFTWGHYEFNFRRPGWVEHFKQWLEDGRKAGFTLMRIRADWRFMEPLPGVFDYSLTDYAIEFARKNHVKIMFELSTLPPEWFNCLPVLSSFGRPDLGQHSTPRATASLWSPGLLDGISNYIRHMVGRYRFEPALAGYMVWGAPGQSDWAVLDKPHIGQAVDFLPEAVAAFVKQSGGRLTDAPEPNFAMESIDLRDEWRDWIHFRVARLEEFFLDHVVGVIRSLDDRRVIAAYNGLDFPSERMAEHARKNTWFRHSGGSHSNIQTPMRLWQEYNDSGHIMPSEVHLMTPTPWEYEQATYNIGHIGGAGFAWHVYWREVFRPGTWEKNRDEGLREWQTFWKPLWMTLRTTEPVSEKGPAILTTWLTSTYLLDSIFWFRTMDFASKLAASAYHEGCSPVFFTENADFKCLEDRKLVVVSEECASVVNSRTEDALVDYVRRGGVLLLCGRGGFYNMEAPVKTGNLLRKLSAPPGLEKDDSSEKLLADNELGGFAAKQIKATPVNTVFGRISLMNLRRRPLPSGTRNLEKDRQKNGMSSAFAWKFGKGEVWFLDGVPDWTRTRGFLAAASAGAGIGKGTSSSERTVLVNHLAGNGRHYLIVHRALREFQSWLPAEYGFPNPREKLAKLPLLDVRLFVRNLPAGKWAVREMIQKTKPDETTFDTATLAAEGIPFRIGAGRTLVFELTPVK